MNKLLRVLAVLAMVPALALATALAAANGPVDPPSVDGVLYPGESLQVTKEVTTPEIPLVLDIVLVQDETGSFNDDLPNLVALAPALVADLDSTGSDYATGVVGFRDFAQDPWGCTVTPCGFDDHVYRLVTDIAPGGTSLTTGVVQLTAPSLAGNDGPEAQLEALHYLATTGHECIDSDGNGVCPDNGDTPAGEQPTWRAGAQRVVLLATDASCHVTGDAGGWPGDSGTTDAATTAAILDAAGITVIGLTPDGAGTIPCVDALAADTGGTVQAIGDSSEAIVEAILAGLEELTTDVWWTDDCGPSLSVSLDPTVYEDVPGNTILSFAETIEVPNDTPPGDYDCTVTFWANEYPEEGAIIGEQDIHIEVKPIPVPVDIKPMSCPNPLNVKKKGVVPVAILGTGELDVTTIDPGTVLLEGVAPLRWAWEDVATPFEPWVGKADCREDCTEEGPDGHMDLTLKFDAQEVVGALGDVQPGQCRVLTLTGNFFDLRAIAGEDVVWIR